MQIELIKLQPCITYFFWFRVAPHLLISLIIRDQPSLLVRPFCQPCLSRSVAFSKRCHKKAREAAVDEWFMVFD